MSTEHAKLGEEAEEVQRERWSVKEDERNF